MTRWFSDRHCDTNWGRRHPDKPLAWLFPAFFASEPLPTQITRSRPRFFSFNGPIQGNLMKYLEPPLRTVRLRKCELQKLSILWRPWCNWLRQPGSLQFAAMVKLNFYISFCLWGAVGSWQPELNARSLGHLHRPIRSRLETDCCGSRDILTSVGILKPIGSCMMDPQEKFRFGFS